MARARNIKPSFFTNEELVELPFECRLLFIGLWTLADREGRIENRPKRIKMSLFPADSIDVVFQIASLQKSGFLRCYSSNGIDVIQIENFVKHQSPHGLEKDSELPDENGFYTVNERSKTKLITGVYKLVKSLDGVSEQLDNSSKTVLEPDQNTLNPESLILNPESLNPEEIKPQAASAKAQKFDFAKSLIELGADEKNVASWLKVRKVKKCVNTEEALNGFVREAEKAELSIADAVLKCAEKSWGGLDADWIKPKAQAVPQRVSAWWASDAMILAKGRELGLSPYAGESMPSFKGRIELKIEGVDKHVDATRGGGFAPVIPPASADKTEKRDMSPEAVAMRKNALNALKVVKNDDET